MENNGGNNATNRAMNDFTDLQEDTEIFEALCEEIALTMPAPRRSLKKQILDAIAALDREESEPPMPRQMTIRADEGEWVVALPGVEMKHLFKDPASGRTTYMARLVAGARYPDHLHHGVEELVMLEGDLVIGGEHLHPGDYIVALPDTTHHEVYSPTGCLCMVSSMMNDEFI
jgi:anti-sigma factor ChrR (cupin superfamily)